MSSGAAANRRRMFMSKCLFRKLPGDSSKLLGELRILIRELKIRLIIFSAILVVLLSSCGPSLMEIRQDYVNTHQNLDPQIRVAILNGEIVAGMTREDVRASLGDPCNTTSGYEAGKYGRYGKYSGHCHYWEYRHYTIIFGENGRVEDVK
jgi:hypothetical protein